MVVIDIVINVLLGKVTRHPAGMHCPSWDDAFVSSYYYYHYIQLRAPYNDLKM